MSLPVAFQSVVFYVMACTPCAQIRHRHKSKVKAKLEREEKARVVAEQPHLYHHPDPFSTNPYWDEEIRMGPSLPRKEKGKNGKTKSSSQRGLANASRDLTSMELESPVTTPGSVLVGGSGSQETAAVMPAIPPSLASSPTMVQEEDTASAVLSKTVSVSTGSDWNLKRYQREDEELWGHEFSRTGQKLMDAIKQAGTTAGRFMESKLGIEKPVTDEDRHNFYFAPRNPPVNDYHPPVVRSKPAHKDGLQWMLQPPPPAKVMEGKIPVNRTGSMMSVGSRRTAGTSDGMSMGRRVGEKALEARLRNGELPYDERSPHSTTSLHKVKARRATISSTRTRSRPTTGSYTSTESDDSSEEMHRRKSRLQSRRTASAFHLDLESSEDECISRSIESLSNGLHPTHAAQKPRLPTILSSESSATTQEPKSVETPSAQPLQEATNKSPVPFEVEKALSGQTSAYALQASRHANPTIVPC